MAAIKGLPVPGRLLPAILGAEGLGAEYPRAAQY